MPGMYGADLQVLKTKADKNRNNPEVLEDLVKSVRGATGNPTVDREEARKVYLHIRRMLKACRSESNPATIATPS